MFDIAHNNADKRDFAELVCEIIIYAQICDPHEIEGTPHTFERNVPAIVWRVGREIASLGEYLYLPTIGRFQFSSAIYAVMHRIIRKRVSKNDSIKTLCTLLEEIDWAIDNLHEEVIERASSFLKEGKDKEALDAVRAVF